MATFTKPQSLNGKQLKDELKAAGVNVEMIIDNADNTISLDVASNKETQVAEIIKNHVGVDYVATAADKLAALGLTADDLKAIGL